MKIKTSITLSEEVLRAIDHVSGESKNRSAFIELAVRDYLKKKAKKLRDDRDLEILNENSKRLNSEAKDVLSYQIEL
jgi:metal-responsive CopG/Arc/MetJ family transcriptional regulator